MSVSSSKTAPVTHNAGLLVRSAEVAPGDMIRDFGELREVMRVDAGAVAGDQFVRLYLAPRAGLPESLLVRREVTIYVRRVTPC
ncbi:MAG TPA: hypothetical protein VGS97_26650 [Actinocrinis sp.]|nr:hypothetical protein [Actinocrinis sp.]